MGTPGSGDLQDFVWESTRFLKLIYNTVMNDKIKLTYLLFSVYLSVLCSLGTFGAILTINR